jgi:cell division transport system ATP-binding protein
MIHLQDAGVVYPDGTTALVGVNLHFKHGEFAFITGASGSGKSTLLQLVYRELQPTSGSVVVDGQDVSQLPPSRIPILRRKVGVVFQDFRLLPRRTVWENVGFALDVIGASRREKFRRIPLVLELVNLEEKAGAFPDQLSGGEQQRVSIARALVNTPPILVADEPTGNLDPQHSRNIVELLVEIASRGTTVVCATHDTAIVDRVRKRVVELVQGVVVRDDKMGGGYHAAQ